MKIAVAQPVVAAKPKKAPTKARAKATTAAAGFPTPATRRHKTTVTRVAPVKASSTSKPSTKRSTRRAKRKAARTIAVNNKGT